MTLEEILADTKLAIYKKLNQVNKSDYSNVLFDSVQKAFDAGIQSLEVLVYEVEISKNRNAEMFEQYKKGFVLNHSVGMRYLKAFFCYNSDAPHNAQDKENWDKYYPMLLNKEEADMSNYFFAVTEAKNIEGSAVVKGSNFLTPVLEITEIDKDTIRVKMAISPSNILDSHKDVHIPGLWKKAINENQYHLLLQEHDMSFKGIISDSINGEFKVYTEQIDVKLLLSKFTKKTLEPPKDTQKNEPLEDTQKTDWKEIINSF